MNKRKYLTFGLASVAFAEVASSKDISETFYFLLYISEIMDKGKVAWGTTKWQSEEKKTRQPDRDPCSSETITAQGKHIFVQRTVAQ